tara:strand:+ start:1055 stop:1393 length:339 start_codon:yes stop_codon:yes gene_type:complete
MKTFLCTILVTATIYHADPKQTDSTPFITASNKVIDSINPAKHRWIAVSRDLEALGFKFGACVLVEGAGIDMDGEWQVQDRMNKRWNKRIDFLVNKEMKYGKWENVKLKLIN